MSDFITSSIVATKFKNANLQVLPVSNPGGNKPWNNNGFVSVGNTYTPANDSQVVKLTGAQSISGHKTFVNGLTTGDRASFPGVVIGQGGSYAVNASSHIIIDNRTTTADLQFLGNGSVPAFAMRSIGGSFLQVTAPYAVENWRFGTSRVSAGPVEIDWSNLSNPYIGLSAYGLSPDVKLQRPAANTLGVFRADGTTLGNLQAASLSNGLSPVTISSGIIVTDLNGSVYSFRSDTSNAFRADAAGIGITSSINTIGLGNNRRVNWSSTTEWYDTADISIGRAGVNTLGVYTTNTGSTLGTIKVNRVDLGGSYTIENSVDRVWFKHSGGNSLGMFLTHAGLQVEGDMYFGIAPPGFSNHPDTLWKRVSPNVSRFVGSDGTTLGTIQAAQLETGYGMPLTIGNTSNTLNLSAFVLRIGYNGTFVATKFDPPTNDWFLASHGSYGFTSGNSDAAIDTRLKRVTAGTVGVYQANGTSLGIIRAGTFQFNADHGLTSDGFNVIAQATYGDLVVNVAGSNQIRFNAQGATTRATHGYNFGANLSAPETRIKQVSPGVVGVYQADGTSLGNLQVNQVSAGSNPLYIGSRANNDGHLKVTTTGYAAIVSAEFGNAAGGAYLSFATSPQVSVPKESNLGQNTASFGRDGLCIGFATNASISYRNDYPVDYVPGNFTIAGNDAYASATVNKIGGLIRIHGGAGAVGGTDGNVVLAHTGSAARGRVLIGTSTDDGSNRLQVNGSATFSGNVQMGNGILFDSTRRIFGAGQIVYQSNATANQHLFANEIGTSLTSGAVVQIHAGGSGVGPGVNLLNLTNQLSTVVASISPTGAATFSGGVTINSSGALTINPQGGGNGIVLTNNTSGIVWSGAGVSGRIESPNLLTVSAASGVVSIAGNGSGRDFIWRENANELFRIANNGTVSTRDTLSQGFNSTTASARFRMLAAGQRVSEVGDGAGAWLGGYSEEYNAVDGIKCAFYGGARVAKQNWSTGSGTLLQAMTILSNLGLVNLVP